MRRFSICALLLPAFALFPVSSLAQTPIIAADGVLNAASYALPGLPNSGIAQGSIFLIYGDNLGPAKLAIASSYPLPSSQGLAGTTVAVTVGGTTVNAYLFYTVKGQVAALLPSNTPLGSGTVRVSYNGQTSAPAPVTVVERTFGIFALNQLGSGPGLIQNVNSASDRPLNGPTTPARPGQTMVLWGTDLGPVSGNEAGGALPGDMPSANVRLFVGAQEATVQYRGRSECCIGIDQVSFTIPSGVEGCSVPVWSTVNGIPSNFVSIAIASSGSACSDPGGYSEADWNTARANGGLRVGALSISRTFTRLIGLPNLFPRTDTIGATYSRIPLETLRNSTAPPLGSCIVLQYPTYTPPAAAPLNAGTATVNGPIGSFVLAEQNVGTKFLVFLPGGSPGPGVVTNGTVVTAGTYNFSVTAGS